MVVLLFSLLLSAKAKIQFLVHSEESMVSQDVRDKAGSCAV